MKNYFSLMEFVPKCTAKESETVCKNAQMLQNILELLQVLNDIRGELGVPVFINSGFRDTNHNKRVGGSSTSQHMKMEAVDITINDPEPAKKILQAMENLYYLDDGFPYLGQVIDYGTFVHIALPCEKHPTVELKRMRKNG